MHMKKNNEKIKKKTTDVPETNKTIYMYDKKSRKKNTKNIMSIILEPNLPHMQALSITTGPVNCGAI